MHTARRKSDTENRFGDIPLPGKPSWNFIARSKARSLVQEPCESVKRLRAAYTRCTQSAASCWMFLGGFSVRWTGVGHTAFCHKENLTWKRLLSKYCLWVNIIEKNLSYPANSVSTFTFVTITRDKLTILQYDVYQTQRLCNARKYPRHLKKRTKDRYMLKKKHFMLQTKWLHK